jgi:phenylalanine-4-hydroxylase
LRQYVVEQDYAQYTARDQALWRFVLTQTHARLLHTAHPAYAQGFARAGISTERIPELAHMDERLSSAGFRVVCVDGFIPPRAFQGFQACGVLPIAADIRSVAHLAYTPAPDIIHEAAGHAPFLPHPEYARFLRRVGACSEHAFETEHDRAVYQAIYALSELKENPQSTAQQLTEAQSALARLLATERRVSEATRMARFYWWTVEYGLVGSPSNFRLYGAGLLSSIGEAHFCHDAKVKKLMLDAHCTEVDYDITQSQPQLFVARDFEHLEQVLEEVEKTLSHVRGGCEALERAAQSGEPATLTVDSGLELVGKVCASEASWVELEAPWFGSHADPHAATPRAGMVTAGSSERLERYLLPLGTLEDGTPLSALSLDTLRRHTDAGGQLKLRTRGGWSIRGQLGELTVHDGRVRTAILHDCEIARGDELWLRSHAAYPLLFAQQVVTASPVLPAGYLPATNYPTLRVPKPRNFDVAERRLIALHEQVADFCSPADPPASCRPQASAAAPAGLSAVHEVLRQHFPREWLLRLNLLEALLGSGAGAGPLARDVERELEQLELYFAHREPIATGLAYLVSLARGTARVDRGTGEPAALDGSEDADARQSGASRRTR